MSPYSHCISQTNLHRDERVDVLLKLLCSVRVHTDDLVPIESDFPGKYFTADYNASVRFYRLLLVLCLFS